MSKKKRQKPEDFIGWKSEDGELEVIGIAGKDKQGISKKFLIDNCDLELVQ